MRDPFDAEYHVSYVGGQSPPEPVLPDMRPSTAGYILGNDDPTFWTTSTDSLVRHQFQRGSDVRLLKDDVNNTLLDHELMELSSKSQQQEEEIMFLRKQIRDASSKELQLLNEKHVLERKLSELRLAIDEKQDDAISDSMKDLTQRRGCIEENLKLTNDLKVTNEQLYLFTSSLLGFLGEYNIRLPVINASTITNSTQRLYQHMKWKIGSNAGIGEMHLLLGDQPGIELSDNRKLATIARKSLSQPGLDSNMNEFQGYEKYPFDFHAEGTTKLKHIPPMSVMNSKGLNNTVSDFGYKFIMDQPKELQSAMFKDVGGATIPNVFEGNAVEAENRRETPDAHFYIPSPLEMQSSPFSRGEASLPGIEVFQIIGEAKPGCTLRACGYPTNGTYLCIFQWVRHLENGTRQSIEGATVPDYVVTADDVDTFLSVDCIPMDESGRQGELVSLFANNQNKITCDSDMQHEIETHLSSGRAVFNVMLLQIDSSEAWEQTSMFLKRSGYQIKVSRTDHVVIEEKYSPELYIKVPNGQSTQFVLICSDGTTLPFSTSGTSQPYSMENDIRLRDIIVLTMRYFQSKAVDGKRKGKA
ncbi:uncharacterized protein LOC110025479 isoform X2 [Phalaenopsis equestris]|uniref:uncharacterized protein LOC110025479 isoform X2 n=1 Tax=Phalaenopsis equestris TaxID=78828 RepID=UPI0009E5A62A|nr:uncharacterized protein LOC110025479 isoform X2 [Phalaenopsis equestris]